jgi:hypothetical protein
MKRITMVDPGRSYQFDVTEQSLSIGGGVRLAGGGYSLRQCDDGSTETIIETRYVSPWRPRWLWVRLEATVCGLFHRYLLKSMRRKIESR